MTRRALLACLTAFCLAATGGVALADDPKPGAAPKAAEVLVVLGKREGKFEDPKLSTLTALKQPPFDSFTDKRLLMTTALSLKGEAESEMTLPNGRKLRLSLHGKTKEGRYRVQVSIKRSEKKDYLPVMTVAAAPGDPFFIAGQKYKGGTLIIGVRIRKDPPHK